MRSEETVENAIDIYGDMVWRLCVVHLKNYADAEDIFQNVFIKYALRDRTFENQTHEKAWLIRVTVNACRDLLGSFFRNREVPLEEALQGQYISDENRYVLEAVMQLPLKYRQVVYLHYYEGYTAKEIGQILRKRENTVYTLLHRAREKLRTILEESNG